MEEWDGELQMRGTLLLVLPRVEPLAAGGSWAFEVWPASLGCTVNVKCSLDLEDLIFKMSNILSINACLCLLQAEIMIFEYIG